MSDEQIARDLLLDRIGAFVRERGISGVRLERVAAALGVPLGTLSEYFESERDLMTALVARNRVRLRESFARLDGDTSTSERDLRRKMWKVYLDAADDSTLFFEAYGLALNDDDYGAFLHGVNDWLDLLAESLERRGVAPERAAARATLTLAAYRGAMLDYCVTRDRARVNAAMELWFDIADRIEKM